MCLLIVHPAATTFDNDDIEDFFFYNQDGVGAMWAVDNTIFIHKILPKTAQEAVDFYNKWCKGKECVIHFRMRTHGLTDTANCHPYEVFGDGSAHPLYMAHNGILSTGNAKDKNMSDTWHYIHDFLKPILERDPEMLHVPAFQALIADQIGSSNKFAFMDHQGRIVVINEAAFVTHQGAKLSNTYAWSAPIDYNYNPRSWYMGAMADDDEWDMYKNPTKRGSRRQHKALGNTKGGWTKSGGTLGVSPKPELKLIPVQPGVAPSRVVTPACAFPETANDFATEFFAEADRLKMTDLYATTTFATAEKLWELAGEEHCLDMLDTMQYYSDYEMQQEVAAWLSADEVTRQVA